MYNIEIISQLNAQLPLFFKNTQNSNSQHTFAISVENCPRASAAARDSDDQNMQVWTLASMATARLAPRLFSLRRSPESAASAELSTSHETIRELKCAVLRYGRTALSYMYHVRTRSINILRIYRWVSNFVLKALTSAAVTNLYWQCLLDLTPSLIQKSTIHLHKNCLAVVSIYSGLSGDK